eukprot:4724139-Pleurochrysis_carterae.AAC.2
MELARRNAPAEAERQVYLLNHTHFLILQTQDKAIAPSSRAATALCARWSERMLGGDGGGGGCRVPNAALAHLVSLYFERAADLWNGALDGARAALSLVSASTGRGGGGDSGAKLEGQGRASLLRSGR